jgi:hypothetical protein
MAQEVGFFENNVVFLEGPFVISNPLGNGWRIEVELKDHYCPVLPNGEITDFIEAAGFRDEKFWLREDAARLCDWLNEQVKLGNITLRGRAWYPTIPPKKNRCQGCSGCKVVVG